MSYLDLVVLSLIWLSVALSTDWGGMDRFYHINEMCGRKVGRSPKNCAPFSGAGNWVLREGWHFPETLASNLGHETKFWLSACGRKWCSHFWAWPARSFVLSVLHGSGMIARWASLPVRHWGWRCRFRMPSLQDRVSGVLPFFVSCQLDATPIYCRFLKVFSWNFFIWMNIFGVTWLGRKSKNFIFPLWFVQNCSMS